MKRFSKILFLFLILLHGCATPTVVDIELPGDKDLNCEQLKDEFTETQRFRKEAETVREVNTGGNMTRAFLFWPALARSMHNAEVAIKAANDRGFHLIKIMKSKNCKGTEELLNVVLKSITPIYISKEIEKLNKLYESGVLSEEEFTQAKKKVLSD
jgi:hypothetical protein